MHHNNLCHRARWPGLSLPIREREREESLVGSHLLEIGINEHQSVGQENINRAETVEGRACSIDGTLADLVNRVCESLSVL